ncbi:MAG: hypothetical protein FJ382_11355 [Verrucomicrobia bacterium]|nr:hypothetical protein [Verrucomicrobiota bacterium]
MNRTLLLILCDFLLLNLLALTRWEQAQPPAPAPVAAPAASAGAGAASRETDLLAAMKASLADERASREQLARTLTSAEEQVRAREASLSQVEAERSRLGTDLEATRRSAEEVARRAAAAAEEAAVSKDRLAAVQRELDEKRREAEEQQRRVAGLERDQAQARERIEGLSVAVRVAEQEKQLLRETSETLRSQVAAEREERLKVQQATSELAQGVGQLAEKSTELSREIRENRPVNANTLFNEFLANRVQTQFTAFRRTFLGPVTRTLDSRTLLVTDGQATYAVLHIDDTPLALRESAVDWERLTAEFSRADRRLGATQLGFLSLDPRIVVLPVTPEQVQALGAKVYRTAVDPFRFPEAVLIANGGAGYGEVPFKLDPGSTHHVRMDNRLVRRVLGEFTPSRGDLVLGKSGELLGIMVNADYCVVLDSFALSQTIALGPIAADQPTGPKLEDLNRRWRGLPLRLQ